MPRLMPVFHMSLHLCFLGEESINKIEIKKKKSFGCISSAIGRHSFFLSVSYDLTVLSAHVVLFLMILGKKTKDRGDVNVNSSFTMIIISPVENKGVVRQPSFPLFPSSVHLLWTRLKSSDVFTSHRLPDKENLSFCRTRMHFSWTKGFVPTERSRRVRLEGNLPHLGLLKASESSVQDWNSV